MSTTNQTPRTNLSFSVPNFTEADHLALDASHSTNPRIGALVNLSMNLGSMHFQHSITPSQARLMAMQLNDMADYAESLIATAGVDE